MNHQQIQTLIKNTLSGLGSKYASEDAINMVYWTGYVESRYEYIKQLGKGPARSFWQVEPDTAASQVENYLNYRPDLAYKCAEVTGTDEYLWLKGKAEEWDKILLVNIASGIVHCRLKYWRIPKPMADNIDDAAKMWKKYYNSSGGAGTQSKFKDMVGSLT
tara:strand:- start:12271 stop:12753 length:483 start_codon:yes stop_codon:yes gene_type:complete